MATYAALTDCTDPVVKVTEDDLVAADAQVEAVLRQSGIEPSEVTLPNRLLANLAVYHASYIAATRLHRGQEGVMAEKAKLYRDLASATAAQVSRAALGIAGSAGSGYGSITLGRG